ncbi:hypothetical protein ASG65_27210 [Bacillus sp. Leaf13]|nr:hypothetical protein ASG65_27210 [Bacillus sp. Leaf13]KRF59369.1 hypothetical protein ASG99_27120 [Bacillus sp. Soil768D1]
MKDSAQLGTDIPLPSHDTPKFSFINTGQKYHLSFKSVIQYLLAEKPNKLGVSVRYLIEGGQNG